MRQDTERSALIPRRRLARQILWLDGVILISSKPSTIPMPRLLVGLAAVIVLATPACSARDAPASGPVTVRDSAGITIVTSDLSRATGSCSLAADPRLTIGDRTGDPAHELYRVFGATLLSDGRLAIVNQGTQELRFYSSDGDFLFASGREGQGPGEFQDAFLLWKLPGDTLWVGDYRPWEFEVFGPDGSWIRTIRPQPLYGNPPQAFAVLSDGRTVLGSTNVMDRAPGFGVQPIYFALHGRDGVLVDTVRVLPNGRWGQTVDEPNSVWLYPWFESFAEIAARGERLVIGHGSVAELQLLRPDSGAKPDTIVRWTGLDLTVTDADVRAAKQAVEDQYAGVDAETRRRAVEPRIHEDRPVADVMPAFSDVMVGTDESIWIKLYPRPGGTAEAEWIRFDPKGHFACRLAVPQYLQVYEFGSDYLVGEEQGEFEVEIVTVYDVRFTPDAI